MEIVQFILGNADTMLAILGSLVVVASLIVGLTPSRADDKVVGIIKGFLERASMIKHNEGVTSTSRSDREE